MTEDRNLNEYEATEAMEVAFDYNIGGSEKGKNINDLRDEIQNANQIPAKGMVFNTDIDAYNFYNGYARLIGFSVRKNKMYRNKASHIARRDFTCSWEGQYKKKVTPKKKREDRRSGCKAMLMIRRDKNGKYVVTDFVENHNHVLVEPEDAHLLRSHRRIENSQQYLIGNMRKAGISTANIISYLSMEAGGAKNLNFTGSDCYNLVSKNRTKFLKEGDAQCLLKYLQDKKAANKFFYYKLRVDESNRFCGVFIADAKSRCDYNNFGDVMCFDTTFKTNNYDMICAPIIGVNHHGQTVIFGLGLLNNETTESFTWLFETFLEAMGEKHPQTIFTDQALAIAKAISLVFPYSSHRLCLWHIGMNAAKNLSKVYGKFKSFKSDFKKCIYNGETVEEFERNWKQMLLTYGLQKNKWLQNLYRLRGRWAQVYARDNFCAGMTTTQRSESINSLLKKFVGGNLILREFIVQHDGVLASRREKERIANSENKKKMPNMVTEWAVEREASQIYTRKAFEIFQSECKRCFTLKVDEYRDDGEECYYKIRRVGTNAKPRSVTYKPATQGAKCSCKKYEFQGILCSHILKVFLELEVSSLPPQFYMKRWTMDATSNLVYDTQGEVIEANLDPERSKRYSELSHWVQILVAKAARTKEAKELAITDVLHTISKLDSLADNDVVTCDGGVSQSFEPATNVNNATEANIPATLLDPISKKRSRQPKGRKKSVIETKKRKTKDKSLRQDKDEQNDLNPPHGIDIDLNEVPDLNEELNEDFDPQPARRLDFTNA